MSHRASARLAFLLPLASLLTPACGTDSPPASHGADAVDAGTTALDASLPELRTHVRMTSSGTYFQEFNETLSASRSIVLEKEQFGQSFTCRFSNEHVYLEYYRPGSVTCNGSFHLDISERYLGPGDYSFSCPENTRYDDVPLRVWPGLITEPDAMGNRTCFPGWPRSPAGRWTCTLAITEHTADHVSGTFHCTGRYDDHEPNGHVRESDSVETEGDFTYLKSDCE